MSQAQGVEVDQAQAALFLVDHLGIPDATATLIGEGTWSRCFSFRRENEALVIRFGHHLDDFQKDQLAYRYAAPTLPIPQGHEIGEAYGGYYAISTQVHGLPLEQVDAQTWRALVPEVSAALETMRTADLSATTGFGGWDATGNAADKRWSSRLLAVDIDLPTMRTHGWRARLASFPQGDAAFRWGYERLQAVVRDDIPRSLLHCDLVNRNVLVDAGKLAGIFDWGCSIYGDHLYELAWFEFWAPWYSQLDIGLLRSTLEQRWQQRGYTPSNKRDRLAACYLHIGLDHLAYNAYLGDWPTLVATAERMQALVP